jgi:hypothetical protein
VAEPDADPIIGVVDAITRIHLEPGDVLAVRCPNITTEQAARIRTHMATLVPGHEVIVVPEGVEFAAITNVQLLP